MQRTCGSTATRSGVPCGHVVADDEDHCRAGHPCAAAGSGGRPGPVPMAAAGSAVDFEDLLFGTAA